MSPSRSNLMIYELLIIWQCSWRLCESSDVFSVFLGSKTCLSSVVQCRENAGTSRHATFMSSGDSGWCGVVNETFMCSTIFLWAFNLNVILFPLSMALFLPTWAFVTTHHLKLCILNGDTIGWRSGFCREYGRFTNRQKQKQLCRNWANTISETTIQL